MFAPVTRLLVQIFEHMRSGAAELKGGFGCDRFDVGRATDTIGSKDFFTHGCLGSVTNTLGGSISRTVAPFGRAISTLQGKFCAALYPEILTNAWIWFRCSWSMTS